MEKTCSTCQHNDHGVCANKNSVLYGTRVEGRTCPVWENYDEEFGGAM